MSFAHSVQGRLLARNMAYSFIGQIAPLFVGLLTVPYLVRGLGVERFGVLVLTWVAIGYFGLLDVGLGRATTKFVAESIGRGETVFVRPIVWASLGFVIVLGTLGGFALALANPWLVERVLKIPEYLLDEARQAFYVAAFSIAITLAMTNLRGVLEAYQRFDLINIVKIPSDILAAVVPVVALYVFHASLPIIVSIFLVKNLVVSIIYLWQSMAMMAISRVQWVKAARVFPALFGYGGWIALHNAAVAVLLNLDRFVVGTLLTLSAVSYYTVPQELANRALIVPSSLMVVLFPVFSILHAADTVELRHRFAQAFKFLALAMGLLAGTLIVFAHEILLLWLGPDFGRSTRVLQIVALGALWSTFAWLFGTFLQAVGSARSVTVIHLVQIPFYVLCMWALVGWRGIEGAAAAWTMRIIASTGLLFAACARSNLVHFGILTRNRSLGSLAWLSAVSGTAIVVKFLVPSVTGLGLAAGLFLMGGAAVVWAYALNGQERTFIRSLLPGSGSAAQGG